MLANDELILLIKSKYPVIFVESIDEEYACRTSSAHRNSVYFMVGGGHMKN